MKTIILQEEFYKGLTIQRIEEDGKRRWKIKEYENFYFSSKKKNVSVD